MIPDKLPDGSKHPEDHKGGMSNAEDSQKREATFEFDELAKDVAKKIRGPTEETRSGASIVLSADQLQQQKLEYQWLQNLEFSRMPAGSPEEIERAIAGIETIYNKNLISTEALVAYTNGDATILRAEIALGGFLNEFRRANGSSVCAQIETDIKEEPNYHVFQLTDPSKGGAPVFYFSLYAPIHEGGKWGTDPSGSNGNSKYSQNLLLGHLDKMKWASSYLETQMTVNPDQTVFVDTVGVDPDVIGKGVGSQGCMLVTRWLQENLPELGEDSEYDILSFRFKRVIPVINGIPLSGEQKKQRDLIRGSENKTSAGLFKDFEQVGTHTDSQFMTREHGVDEYKFEIEWLDEFMELNHWNKINTTRIEKRKERAGL